MAAGAAPVASSDVSATRDLIRNGETGFTFAPRDWDALAQHVARLVDDAELRQRIGRAAQVRSASYSYDAAVHGILGALSSFGLCASAA
jgi:glycosyltransferase involved in cell wall biosynthesis